MKTRNLLFVLALMFVAVSQTSAQSATMFSVDDHNVAVGGYDVVTYFTMNKATKGEVKYQAIHEGATFYFSSKENLKSFQQNPSKYAPQYGGYCAYAVANGGKYPINPETFKIVEGRLFLFYNQDGTNTLTLWNKDEAKLLKAADASWKK